MNKTTLITLFLITILLETPLVSATNPVHIDLSFNTLRQGQTLKIELFSHKPIQSATVKLSHNTFKFFKKSPKKKHKPKHQLLSLVGISRKLAPKQYFLQFKIHFQDGTTYQPRYKFWVKSGLFKKESITLPPKSKALSKNTKQINSENRILGAKLKARKRYKYFTYPFMIPVKAGRITSPSGGLRVYNGKVMWSHSGVDFGKKLGAPIHAANHGKVTYAGSMMVHGNSILIDHGWGIISIYNHLKDIYVKPKQFVKRGDIIGTMGQTGISTGPHLHWGLSVQSVRVDPLYWITRRFLYD